MRINKRYKIILILLAFGGALSFIIFLKYIKIAPRPNVLLITIDALRPDHLGCYGYKRNTSPNIDRLARDGVIFTQAISQSSWTPPSIFSILTSTYPQTHGVYNFGVPMNCSLQTLPDILKDKGYYLGLISGRGKLSEFHFAELEDEFDTFHPVNSTVIYANKVTERAIEWLRKNKEKNFFFGYII